MRDPSVLIPLLAFRSSGITYEATSGSLVTESERAWQSLGQITYGAEGSEIKSKAFRRSLYVIKDMKAGDTFTENNLRAIRPGLGLPPKELEFFLGKKINRDVKKGTALSWGLVG